jgi:hypothetical protein
MKKLFYILCCSLVVLFTACEKGELSEKSIGDGSTSGSGVSKVHEYVDLGLSVKWATCNVGATKPEDYGDYFAWGETAPKSTYSSSNYSYSDNTTTLPLKNDAANVNWGGDWRMPTKEEQDELRTECTWVWETMNGVEGYTVIGPNGRSIFLPATGFRANSDLNNAGTYGYYWSSSLYVERPGYASLLAFVSERVDWSATDIYGGLTIRPVLP